MRIKSSAQTEVQGLSSQEAGVGPTSDLSQLPKPEGPFEAHLFLFT